MSVVLANAPNPELEPIHFSRLKQMARSAAHYKAAVDIGTTAMQRGTAVHAMLLNGGRVIAYPGAVRRGKEWEAFAAANDDAHILTATEYSKAAAMADAVRAHPEAMRLLDGEQERVIEWTYLGRACSSRPDVAGDGFVTELKTAATSDPFRFTMQAIRMAYHAQLAFYRQALLSLGAEAPPAAYVVAVESSPPWNVTVLKLTDRALDHGSRLFRLWFEKVLVCEAADSWPGYVQSTVALDVPDDLELTYAGEETVPVGSDAVPF